MLDMSVERELSAFLLEQIAGDEQRARCAHGHETGSLYEGQPLAWVSHARGWSTGRVLGECQMKRWLVQQLAPAIDSLEAQVDGEFGTTSRDREYLGMTLRKQLARAYYVTHPDFRDEWLVNPQH